MTPNWLRNVDAVGKCSIASQCDYGYLIRLGRNSFLNDDAIVMDCAPVVIGDGVSIGPRAQLLTALHPLHDFELRRQRWETAAPITINDNVWLAW